MYKRQGNNNELINDNNKVSKVFKYLRLKVKLKRVLSKIWFNKQCLDNNVIPKYAQVKFKNKNSVAKKVKEQSEKLWIKLEIRSVYGLINRYNRELYDRHIELLRIYSNVELEEILYNFGLWYVEKKLEKKNKKLHHLILSNCYAVLKC